jgi:hypothetical protein
MDKKDDKIYLIKDSKFELNIYDYLKETGQLDRLKRDGIPIYPTHNAQLLRDTRLGLYLESLKEFKEERKTNKLATTEQDLDCFFIAWFTNELSVIEKWLSQKETTTSNQIEINKYKEQFVISNLDFVKKKQSHVLLKNDCFIFNNCSVHFKNKDKSCYNLCNVYQDWFLMISEHENDYNFQPLNLQQMSIELATKNNITERLEHWFHKYWKPLYHKFYNTVKPYDTRRNIISYQEQLSNPNYGNCGGTISIPTPVFNQYFSNDWQTKECLLWRLDFDSKYFFQTLLEMCHWHEKLNAPIAAMTIRKELTSINSFENEAQELYENGTFDIYKNDNYLNNKHLDHITFLRTKAKCHKKATLEHNFHKVMHLNTIHNYLKPYLESELAKLQTTTTTTETKLPLPKPNETQNDQLKNKLTKYAFFELQKVKELKEEKQTKLIKLISSNDAPFQVAMLSYLGFFEHLIENYSKTKEQLYSDVSRILEKSKRNIKGNYLVLSPNSKEDRTRYTADTFTNQVKKEYKKLK